MIGIIIARFLNLIELFKIFEKFNQEICKNDNRFYLGGFSL